VQVLAQQHGSPVLGLGAAGAGLDVDEAVQGVGRVGEHAAEFERFQALAQGGAVLLDGEQGGVVVIRAGQFEQVAGVVQAAFDVGQGVDDGFQGFLFAAQFLGMLRIVPDVRAFQFGVDDEQAFGLGIVVKDTSGAGPGARRSRRCGR
jgi:hypothetical protein